MRKPLNKASFRHFYHSLRGKFILVSVSVAVILILASAFSYFYISHSSSAVTTALEQRVRIFNQTRVIMDNVWDVSFFLEEHSIAPSDESRSIIFNKMIVSVNKLISLIEEEENNPDVVNKLQSVLVDFNELGIHINQLIQLRSDPSALFPAIEISRSAMFDSQSQFSYLVGLSIDEAVSALDYSGTEALVLLINLRYQWTQMISFYRMYLVNRLALMDKSVLGRQVDNINLYITNINKVFTQLEQLNAENKLEFQASDAIPLLKNASHIWVQNFREIVSTSMPEEWRTDYPIIKTKIAPLMKNIWESMLDYNRSIEFDLTRGLHQLSSVAANINYLLWGMTLFGLIILAAMFYFIHITLLKPIQTISTAMRAEAHDGRYLKPLLLKGKSVETENLIDAFSSMQLQVHSRKNELEHQALHDSLTNLPNRLLLFDRLQQAISKQKRNRGSLALIMMDLDRFKEINDTMGHHAGDELLQYVSKRLVDCLRDADTVARLGGDEFAILIPDCDQQQAEKIALKIQECMRPAIQLYDQSLYIHGSLGVSVYPDHGTGAEMLLKNADIAMYLAKNNNSLFEVYDYEQDRHSLNRLALKHELQRAIHNDELCLYYQPQIHCHDLSVAGVEALLRWKKQNGEKVAPDVFIPLAEESGLIKQLTEWIIIEAIQQQKLWKQNNVETRISINLSAWNLLDPGLDKFVSRNFDEYGVEKNSISFEITESVMMTDTEQALKMMKSLKSIGCDLIVDDFGTGFSSLAYLKKFPVKELKIDKSFVINMIDNDNDSVIVKSTIDLAHNLGLQVIAEGVESQEVFDIVSMLGCDMVQGYFTQKPVSGDELQTWYQNYRSSIVS